MNINPEEYRIKAEDNFIKGYNCTQAIVLAFEDLLNYDTETLIKMASPFGGGMGRLRETCGAFSGVLIVLGLLEGYSTPEFGKIKNELYAKVQLIGKDIEEKFGSLRCRDLLGTKGHDSPVSPQRDENFYKTRPCCKIIGYSAFTLANYLLSETNLETSH